MKKNFYYLLISSLILIAVSCKEQPVDLNSEGPDFLRGGWVHNKYEDNIEIMKRSTGLDSNEYSFIFFSDGKFLERKNSGWCGTPPISYANYNGTWEMISDSLINIRVGYWGGMTLFKMKIVSLTQNEFKYIIEK